MFEALSYEQVNVKGWDEAAYYSYSDEQDRLRYEVPKPKTLNPEP